MHTHADPTQTHDQQPIAEERSHASGGGTFQFSDHRPGSVAQRKLQELANQSPLTEHMAQLQATVQQPTAQLHAHIPAAEPHVAMQQVQEEPISVHTPLDGPVQKVPFDQFIPSLVPKGYYYFEMGDKQVMGQYVGQTNNEGEGLLFHFNVLGSRADKTVWNWITPMFTEQFALEATSTGDISPVETPQEFLTNLGYAPTDVNWHAELASAKTPHDQWAYTKLNSLKLIWHPIQGWHGGAAHNGNVNLFSPTDTDQIVENSTAYLFGNFIAFLYGPDQTEGYRFEGDIPTIIAQLANYFNHINKAAMPRSGKARAASDDEAGQTRAPAPDEAAYGAATKALDSAEGTTQIDARTTVKMAGRADGSTVEVTHTGPWKKGDRGAGQSSAMGGQNAKNYVVDNLQNPDGKSPDTLRQELGGRYEWLHVVGSSLGGINSKENLVAGSYDANTKMIALEHRVARWGSKDYTGEHQPTVHAPIVIVGDATTVPNTRVGLTITLQVSHGGKQIVSGHYDVMDQTVITKSQYEAEEKRVDDEVKINST